MLYLGMPGFAELWPILAVVVLLFGAKKIPELARSMGSGINQFKKGLNDPDEEEQRLDKGDGSRALPDETRTGDES